MVTAGYSDTKHEIIIMLVLFFFFGIDYMFCFAYESIRQQDGERKEEKQLILESANWRSNRC